MLLKNSKALTQRLLRRLGLYQRLKASCIYDFYWRIADPRLITTRMAETAFYRLLLKDFQPGDLIFDIGANQGYKTDIFLRLGAKVIAIDPDDVNQRTLREKFLRYRFVKKPVQVVGKAVSDKASLATMFIDEPGSAKNSLSQRWVDKLRHDDSRFGHRLNFGTTLTVETTTIEELIDNYGQPVFVKIDVEGHEIAVLRGMKRAVRYLSFEVNLPEFLAEGLQCVDRLREIAEAGRFNYVTDTLDAFELKEWVSQAEFRLIFARITSPSVEVFWRTD